MTLSKTKPYAHVKQKSYTCRIDPQLFTCGPRVHLPGDPRAKATFYFVRI